MDWGRGEEGRGVKMSGPRGPVLDGVRTPLHVMHIYGASILLESVNFELSLRFISLNRLG